MRSYRRRKRAERPVLTLSEIRTLASEIEANGADWKPLVFVLAGVLVTGPSAEAIQGFTDYPRSLIDEYHQRMLACGRWSVDGAFRLEGDPTDPSDESMGLLQMGFICDALVADGKLTWCSEGWSVPASVAIKPAKLERFACKVAGCTEYAYVASGPYARLCGHHRLEDEQWRTTEGRLPGRPSHRRHPQVVAS